ncbi:STAT5B.2 family protein [Megaselia abdita]
MSYWKLVSECQIICNFYKTYGIFEIRSAHAEWIEEQMKRIYCDGSQMQDETVNRFYLGLSQQCTNKQRNQLIKFNQNFLFQILLEGYKNDCEEATTIQSFTGDVKIQLNALSQSIHEMDIEMNELEFNIVIDLNLWDLERITNLIIDQKLKEFQASQKILQHNHRIVHYINNLQDIYQSIFWTIANFNHIIDCRMSNVICQDLSALVAYKARLEGIQEKNVASSIIIEEQPPQILKSKTNFTVSLRCLLNDRIYGNFHSAKIGCFVLSEQQAKEFVRDSNASIIPYCLYLQDKSIEVTGAGQLSNNISRFERNLDNNNIVGRFRNIKLLDYTRSLKRENESVADEKFTLLFVSFLTGDNYEIKSWTMSLPVIVTVHGSQELQSLATITWDNSFAEQNRLPFDVPESISWEQMRVALNQQFLSRTNRGLTHSNLNVLYSKLCSHNDFNNGQITRSQFCKRNLPNQLFTFWDWFYSAIKLIKTDLHNHWFRAHILGFIDKSEVEEILKDQPIGTFILRFSERKLGAISINVKQNSGVTMIQPWTSEDFAVRSLDLRIHDVNSDFRNGIELKWIYVNQNQLMPVAHAFTIEENEVIIVDGYVNASIGVRIDNTTTNNTLFPIF